MTQSTAIPSDERIVDAMIQLARAAKSHHMIVAGSNSSEIFLELHRRGYARVTTTKTAAFPAANMTWLLSPGASTRSGPSQRRSTGSCTF
jgi:hypothetical protein